ncbi:class I SAM-dependent methyltransferase [Lentzea sp.]|uniref:class I SAM-dependent methyltransferase n=1 Tax=Lentzea sp. TaxID=56099 RepID=UPI002C685410|nr:methyltransferase domain-containing protein [Lentzea sp.]HUQ57784.1 methyltransferase domain-containing protein [Lentzea sp.]
MAVSVADLRPGERVLDACCGTGASAIPAARLVGRRGLVDAVDLSEPMIGELWWLSKDLPQLRAHRADVTSWTAGGYDVVQSALGISYFPDMAAGTEHLISLARPGGRVVFTIWRDGAMLAADRHLRRAIAEAMGAPPPQPRAPHPVEQINQVDRYAAWLRERGLTDVEVVVNRLALTMTPEVAWLVIAGSGFRGALAKVPAPALDTVRELYLASLRDEGLAQLDATTLIGSGCRS